MEGIVNPDVSLLDEVKIQVLVPVLRALRTELGKERADQLVTTALRGWSRDVYARIAAGSRDREGEVLDDECGDGAEARRGRRHRDALTRTQTIMQGAAYCDFRYRMKE